MADQNISLVLNIEGQQLVDALRQKLDQAKQEMGELTAAFGRGEISGKEFADSTAILQKSQADLVSSLRQVEQESERYERQFESDMVASIRAVEGETDRLVQSQTRLTGSMQAVGSAAGNRAGAAGYAVLELSRGLEDLQYGIAGVLNNIPALVQDLGKLGGLTSGAGAAIAGGISLAAVAAFQLYRHWDDIVGLFMTETPHVVSKVDELKATIEDLSKKKVKLDVDVERLEAAKRELKEIESSLQAVEKLRVQQAEYEQRSGQAIQRAIAEGPEGRTAVAEAQRRYGERAVAESPVIRQIDARMREADQEIFRLREEVKRTGDVFGTELRVGGLQREIAGLQAQRQQAIGAITGPQGQAAIEFGRVIREATQGVGEVQERAQERLANDLRSAGFDRLARVIQDSSPLMLEAAKRQDDVIKQGQQWAKEKEQIDRKVAQENERAQDKAIRERDRLTDALNHQGEVQDRMGREAADRQAEHDRKQEERDRRQEMARTGAAPRVPSGAGIGFDVGAIGAGVPQAGAGMIPGGPPEAEDLAAQIIAGEAAQAGMVPPAVPVEDRVARARRRRAEANRQRRVRQAQRLARKEIQRRQRQGQNYMRETARRAAIPDAGVRRTAMQAPITGSFELARRGNGVVAATQQAMAETQNLVQMIAVQQEVLMRQAIELGQHARKGRARTQSALPSQVGWGS